MIELLFPVLINKESFDGNKKHDILTIVYSLAISICAVYFSWTCNSAIGMSALLKIIYASFAFIFGPLYFLYYILIQQSICKMSLKN